MQETGRLQPIAEIIDIFDKRRKDNGIFFLSSSPHRDPGKRKNRALGGPVLVRIRIFQ
ncbi:hypothetical protein [Neorhizobium petrolearium]|uniref:hypothetical protein n=1 Tax=Neorhizobium petrolearium TaxID=515361 RepID=UPI003F14E8FF